MPIDVAVDPQKRLITSTVRGEVTSQDLRKAFMASLAHPDFQPGMNVLFDMTDGKATHLTAQDLLEHTKTIASHQRERGDSYRVAILAPGDVEFGMFRVYQGLGSGLPIGIGVFRERHEAEAWVSRPS